MKRKLKQMFKMKKFNKISYVGCGEPGSGFNTGFRAALPKKKSK